MPPVSSTADRPASQEFPGGVRAFASVSVFLLLALTFIGCRSINETREPITPSVPLPTRPADKTLGLTTVGYCPCQECGQWEHTHWGKTIYSTGPNRGFPMEVGVTSTGLPMRPGTIAANPDVFPYGTIMDIPGYGTGRVEDAGTTDTPNQIDLHFRTHDEVEAWGRQRKSVRVWLP